MNFDHHLSEDFLFLQELSRSPELVFPVGSKELQLTHQWMDHLALYQCEHLDDRRLANMYMSHLCAALAQGKLYGPFLKEPPEGKLEKVDFHEMAISCSIDSFLEPLEPPIMRGSLQIDEDVGYSHMLGMVPRTANSTAHETQGQISVGSTNLSFHVSSRGKNSSSTCSCPPQPCPCAKNGGSVCHCNRSTAGADITPQDEASICKLMQELNLKPHLLENFYANFNSALDLCECNSLESRMPLRNTSSVSKLKKDRRAQSPEDLGDASFTSLEPQLEKPFEAELRNQTSETFSGITSSSLEPPLDFKEMQDGIVVLLKAISAELCGDVKPGDNAFLDHELERYQRFVMTYSNSATDLQSLSAGTTLRTFLLLGLQRDLVTLFCDLTPDKGNI